MPKESEIPGLHGGMYFEHYRLQPLSTLKESVVPIFAKFINITFHDAESIPDSAARHFDGPTFRPTDDITLDEFLDVMSALEITVSTKELEKLPDSLRSHFTGKTFYPFDDFTFQDYKDFMTGVVHFRLGTKEFNSLPTKTLKRQFIVHLRNGDTFRWGSRWAKQYLG